MRNNQDRLGSTNPGNLQSASEAPAQNNVEFIVPTEIVEIPSKGLFYDEGHPLHHKDTVEIKHMTTKEEDILTNQSYIKSGTAVDRLLQSVLVDKRIRVKDLLIGDKNAITMAARVYGYGSDYETGYTCPACGTSQTTSFNLLDIENIDSEASAQEYDVTYNYDAKLINFIIPRNGIKLELKFLKEESEKQSKKNKNVVISNFFQKIIHSVNGNSDPRYIKSYINSMSALDSRYLRTVYQKIIPNIDLSCEFECSNCGHQDKVEVPLNADFFWP